MEFHFLSTFKRSDLIVQVGVYLPNGGFRGRKTLKYKRLPTCIATKLEWKYWVRLIIASKYVANVF